MSRHSKNNTAAAFFTYEERRKLDYGTKETRLGRDSMRLYDACYLCLRRARDPVICSHGHLTCRECILESLLAQKEQIRMKTLEYKGLVEAKHRREQELVQQEKIISVHNFEQQQGSILTKRKQPGSEEANHSPSKQVPSYWIPSKTPSHTDALPAPPKKDTFCTATEKPHIMTMKQLYPIVFSKKTHPASQSGNSVKNVNPEEAVSICPICCKELGNNLDLLVYLPCGHVICTKCSQNTISHGTPSKDCSNIDCLVCQQPIQNRIPLYKEGTGFAGGGGKVLVKRHGIAFQ